MYHRRVLLISDFDGTAFQTKREVEAASYMAVNRVFGEEVAEYYSDKLGGLKNRSPSELMHALIPDNRNIFAFTKSYVEEKLNILESKIGKDWPEPCEGFVDFYQEIVARKISFAIASSGHKGFIEKTFRTKDLVIPKIIISDDEIRKHAYLPQVRRDKPATLPMDMAYCQWLNQAGYCYRGAKYGQEIPTKDEIIYFGDSLLKDGKMAERGGVKFGYFVPESAYKNEPEKRRFTFGNWKEIIQYEL